MEKYRVKAKFHKREIVCISQILCSDCPESNNCQDIDIFIEQKYQGVRDCMSHDSHEKRNGKLKQRRWGK
ncbi:hypothetical protein [Alkaliphilus metalliredigens]|uniref:hypothetical protein n=1 Tax=Alkaliphilus metalliredigens TaxID=208226 RepID=UPI0002FA28D1|nr:hypothetical protein [Alkaliphilus metalliredigens]